MKDARIIEGRENVESDDKKETENGKWRNKKNKYSIEPKWGVKRIKAKQMYMRDIMSVG